MRVDVVAVLVDDERQRLVGDAVVTLHRADVAGGAVGPGLAALIGGRRCVTKSRSADGDRVDDGRVRERQLRGRRTAVVREWLESWIDALVVGRFGQTAARVVRNVVAERRDTDADAV